MTISSRVRPLVGLLPGMRATPQARNVFEHIELEVSFIGGGGFRSESIPVWQGDHLSWVIMSTD